MFKKLIWLLPLALFAYEGYEPVEGPIKPWFTGPLISTSGNITPKGHWNIEPYTFATTTTAFYNDDWSIRSEETLWTLQFRVPTYVGLTEWLDLKFTPVWHWRHRKNAGNWSLGDFSVQIDFQLYRSSIPPKSWLPSIKFTLRETIPTGKYRNLNPQKWGTDAGGNGTWLTTFQLNLSKIFSFGEKRFLNALFNFQYGIPAPTHVKGLNAYGGGLGTNGTIYPEKTAQANLGFEYSLNRNWVIALDAVGVFNSKTRFSGNSGIDLGENPDINPSGVPTVNERKALIQYSLAPAIEYNWSKKLGLIAGCWLTVAGKNSPKFTSGVIALNYAD